MKRKKEEEMEEEEKMKRKKEEEMEKGGWEEEEKEEEEKEEEEERRLLLYTHYSERNELVYMCLALVSEWGGKFANHCIRGHITDPFSSCPHESVR